MRDMSLFVSVGKSSQQEQLCKQVGSPNPVGSGQRGSASNKASKERASE